jgi:ATP-binding cassette subfamily A (ABC1) protein 3
LTCVSQVSISAWTNNTGLSQVYTSLQNGLGLIFPGANLARAMCLSMNTFDSLCGKFGIDDVSNPIAYSRYGGVYFNLVLQILFLSCCIGIYEYGSAQWLRRRIPTLHHSGNIPLYTGKTMSTQDDEIPLTDLVAKHRSSGIRTTVDSQRNAILQISHATKYFGKSTASKDISFDVRENETMALLGGNGAGKTTLFNMIRGELRPDEGDIRVSGISVMDQPRKARVHIGVCPQDDAVDNLTVRQTLEFYGSVKGLKNVHGNVKQVMNALKITRFEHHTHKLLCGGTKRKLTVAIALLGNPRLLLLDEPSTGQDAGAKRLLWRALKRVSKDRAILLTTHSMEEAEALASKAVIVSTRMLAVGSLSSLQELHGGLYKIRAVRSDSVIKSAAETQVRVTLGRWGIEGHNYWDSNGLVQFNVVYDRTTLGRIMVAMERLVGNSDIISGLRTDSSHRENEGIFTAYNITGPTMEEVFMNVVSSARGSGQSDSV